MGKEGHKSAAGGTSEPRTSMSSPGTDSLASLVGREILGTGGRPIEKRRSIEMKSMDELTSVTQNAAGIPTQNIATESSDIGIMGRTIFERPFSVTP